MRLCFLLVRRVPPVPSPVLVEVERRLRRRGFAVSGLIAEEVVSRPDRLTPEHDLYLLKSHTELSLSLAAILSAQGAALLNPYPSCATTQDKIVAARRLAAAAVPVPDCWLTGELGLLREVARTRKLIVKPYKGHRGVGIHLVDRPEDLDRIPPSPFPLLVQERVSGRGEDVKVYVIGDEVFAVRKPFSEGSFAVPGQACAVDPEVRRIALACGAAFGLGLYGLDVIESPDGPVVVDLNYFPGYKGVPDAAPLIADYVEAYAEGMIRLALPTLGADVRTPA